MSEVIAARLRQLARDHYEGRIAFDTYLRVRGQALDSLIGLSAQTSEDPAVITQPRRPSGEFFVTTGEQPVAPATSQSPSPGPPAPVPEPPHPITAVPATPTPSPAPGTPVASQDAQPASRASPARRAEDKAPSPSSAPQPAHEPERRRKRQANDLQSAPSSPAPTTPAPIARPRASRRLPLLAAAGIGSLVLGSLLSWFWFSGNSDPTTADSAEQAPASPARLLVDDFLLDNDWSDSRVAQFNFQWKSLSADHRRSAFDSLWLRDFVEAVRSRVKEQRALAAGEEERRIAGPLAELSATFGIDVSAPDRVVLPAAIQETQPQLPAATTPKQAAGTPAGKTPDSRSGGAEQPDGVRQPPPAVSRPPPPRRDTKVARAPARVDKPIAPATTPAAPGGKQAYPECIAVPVRSRLPLCQDPLAIGGFGPTIALMPQASFQMGSNAAPEERPVRTVTLAKPIGLSVHEISQGEFRTYCAATGRAFPPQPAPDDDRAMVNVTWHEARGYAEWLSSVTGQRYRLPSEAEWEYAARAGESGLYPKGTQLAPTDAHFSGVVKPHRVASRKDRFNYNRFRLYHTVGNVREWVLDGWRPNFEGAPGDGTARSADAAGMRVVRGGAYTDTAAKLRLSTRERLAADARDPVTGFRVLREIP